MNGIVPIKLVTRRRKARTGPGLLTDSPLGLCGSLSDILRPLGSTLPAQPRGLPSFGWIEEGRARGAARRRSIRRRAEGGAGKLVAAADGEAGELLFQPLP